MTLESRSLFLIAVSLAALLVFALSRSSFAQCPWLTTETRKLTASDGAAEDNYGYAVSVAGNVAIVGAIRDDDAGSAYVLRRNGLTWVEEQKLTASDGMASHVFGWSVAVDDDVALIGAPGEYFFGSIPGSVYVNRYDGSAGWLEETILTASDGEDDDKFGVSVSINGNVAVVGAYWDDDLGSKSGSAYVFRYDETMSTWVQEQKLIASDGVTDDWFGASVFVSGDVAIIGALGDDDQGDASGSAYVFRYDADSQDWIEEQKLIAGDGAAEDSFGSRASLSGDVAVVGAFGHDDLGSSSGSAYVYRFNGTLWIEEQELHASDGAPTDKFGKSVSVSGDVVVVGADGERAAYVYRWNGSTWIEDQKLTASDGAPGDFFGFSVSVSDEVVIVGSHLDDDLGSNSGSVYLFDLCGDPGFERGDCNEDSGVDLGDAIFALNHLFPGPGGPTTLSCADACDINDDGTIDLGDPISLLNFLFVTGTPPPPAPSGGCGTDPTPDALDCASFAACP